MHRITLQNTQYCLTGCAVLRHSGCFSLLIAGFLTELQVVVGLCRENIGEQTGSFAVTVCVVGHLLFRCAELDPVIDK